MLNIRRDNIWFFKGSGIVMENSDLTFDENLNKTKDHKFPFQQLIPVEFPKIQNKDKAEVILASFFINIMKEAKIRKCDSIGIPFFYDLTLLDLETFADISISTLMNLTDIYEIDVVLVCKNVNDFMKLKDIYDKYKNNKRDKGERRKPEYIVFKNFPDAYGHEDPYYARVVLHKNGCAYQIHDVKTKERIEGFDKFIDNNYLFPLFDEILEYAYEYIDCQERCDYSDSKFRITLGYEENKERKYFFKEPMNSATHSLLPNAIRRFVLLLQIGYNHRAITAYKGMYRKGIEIYHPILLFVTPNPQMGWPWEAIAITTSNIGTLRFHYPTNDDWGDGVNLINEYFSDELKEKILKSKRGDYKIIEYQYRKYVYFDIWGERAFLIDYEFYLDIKDEITILENDEATYFRIVKWMALNTDTSWYEIARHCYRDGGKYICQGMMI